jgi:hypothetical protein
MSSVRPILASLLVLVGIVSPVVSELHFLVVEHAVCLEHGELVEEDGRSVEELDAAERQTDNDFVGPVLASSHEDDHEHGCDFLLPPTPNGSNELVVLVRPYDLDFAPPLLREVDAPRAVPLNFAPKTSPPRS